MSTIKSSDEHLTLNADGTSKDIKFQANGVEKASISSSGAFTSTSINTGTIEADDKVTISYEAGSSDWELESTSGDDFTISRNSTQRLLIDGSNGNVGIGTSPSYKLHTLIGAGEASGVGILNTSGQGLNIYTDSTASNADVSIDQGATGAAIIFRQNGTERMRIASTQLLIGATTASGISNSNSNYGLALSGDGQITSGTNNDTNAIFNMSNGSNEHHVLFRSDGTTTGYISTNGSSVAYNTGSDYRLKENVDYDWDATTRLKQLKPARFNFIADETNTLVDGFIAHEVSSVVPEAITGQKDAMIPEVLYAEGDDIPEGKSVGDVKTAAAIDPQGIDQSKLVPLLVKTIQELEARITALEA